MEYKHIKKANKEDLKRHNTYILDNIYNDKYKHLIGNSHYSQDLSTKDNDGWSYIIFNILNDEKEIIGMIQFNLARGNNTSSINGVYVKQEYLGLGFGKKAMIEFINFCKTRFVRLELTTTSEKLSTFYESIGFRLVGVYKKRIILPDFKTYDDYMLEIVF